MSLRSFSLSSESIFVNFSQSFLQRARTCFTHSESSGSGEFKSLPSVGKLTGSSCRALSQPRAHARESERSESAVSAQLGPYFSAMTAFSAAFWHILSIRCAQYCAEALTSSRISAPQTVFPASSASASIASSCAPSHFAGRAWLCVLRCSASTVSASLSSLRPAPTESARSLKPSSGAS